MLSSVFRARYPLRNKGGNGNRIPFVDDLRPNLPSLTVTACIITNQA